MTVADDIVEVPRRDDGGASLCQQVSAANARRSRPARRDHAELRKRIEAFAPDWLLLDSWAGYLAGSRSCRGKLDDRCLPIPERRASLLSRAAACRSRHLKIKLALKALRLFSAEREIRSDGGSGCRHLGRRHERMGQARWGGKRTRCPSDVARSRGARGGGPNETSICSLSATCTPRIMSRACGGSPARSCRSCTGAWRRALCEWCSPAQSRTRPDLASWRKAGIVCAPNPADVSVFYSRARVVINPLRQGSGVNSR